MSFRAGSLPTNPSAVCGPFKAFLSSISVKVDFRTGKREAGFYLVIVGEPRAMSLQTREPFVAEAEDDLGTPFPSNGSRVFRNREWNTADSNVVCFDDEWNAVRLPVQPKASFFRRLALEVPARLVQSNNECRFQALKPGAKPETRTAGGTSFTVSDFESLPGQTRVKIAVAGKDLGGFGAYEISLESEGKPPVKLYPRSISSGPGSIEMDLEARHRRDLKIEEGAELVIVFPGETVQHRLRFEFRDVKLP